MEFEKFGIGIWDSVFKIRDLGLGLGANHFGIGMGLGSRMPTSAHDDFTYENDIVVDIRYAIGKSCVAEGL